MSKQGENLEIERRWLLKSLPAPESVMPTSYIDITSIYLLADPQIEVRMRRASYRRYEVGKADTFCLETKLGQGMSRPETPKLAVDSALFFDYYQRNRFPYLAKHHWEFPLPSGLKLEISEYAKPTSAIGLVLAEIEFKSEGDANRFSKRNFPIWLPRLVVKEVTEDSRYNGKNLAVHGRPNPA